MSTAGPDIARLDGAPLIEVATLSDADRAVGRHLASTGKLYAHPMGGNGGLFGDELRRLTALATSEAQRADGVVALGSCRGDLEECWTEIAGGLDCRQERPDAAHIALVADDELHRHVDGELHEAFGHRHFGDQLRFGRLVHDALRTLIVRVKALFRGSV